MLRAAAVPLVALILLPLASPASVSVPLPVAEPGCAEELLAARLIPEPDVSPAPCPGIRPGAALVLHLGPEWWFPLSVELILCTMGFIVTDGTDLYVTTAGHCIVDADNKIPPGSRAEMAGGLKFGTPVYAWCEGHVTNAPCSLGRDFGLILVDADKHHLVSGAMCAWGTPSGGLFTDPSYARDPLTPAFVQHFGWAPASPRPPLASRRSTASRSTRNPRTPPRSRAPASSSAPTPRSRS